jgi:uncharacterized protein Usg
MPDHPSLLQEFIWQTEDTIPELIRIHRFLNHWQRNIDAAIQQIMLAVEDNYRTNGYRRVDHLLTMN